MKKKGLIKLRVITIVLFTSVAFSQESKQQILTNEDPFSVFNIAKTYVELNKEDSAFIYFKEALKGFTKKNLPERIAETNLEIYTILKSQNKLDVNRAIYFDNLYNYAKQTNSKKWLAEYQSNLSAATGITHLKIKYTNAAWYFIEINKNAQSQILDDFVHKQTLVNAVRFTTAELDSFAKKMYESESNIANMEYECYCSIREQVLGSFENIKQISAKIAQVDFISWLSSAAYKNHYIRPEIWSDYAVWHCNHRLPCRVEI